MRLFTRLLSVAVAVTLTGQASGDAPSAGSDPYFPYLAGEDPKASVSVGDTSNGYLVSGVPLVESDVLAILPKQRKRSLAHASAELIALLEYAAKQLREATPADATKTRLWVGNLSRRGGGDIDYSVSHNSGRDADIAFAYLDARGKPYDPPDLLPLGDSGKAVSSPVTLDVARTWLIVKALLSHPEVQVQYLFISHGLKKLLLNHAREKGENSKLLERAATVLRQPGLSAPHNDHLHLRIYCSKRDVLRGCSNTGVVHPWINTFDKARKERSKELAATLGDESAEQRKRAIERLVLLRATVSRDAIAEHLNDDDDAVRLVAVNAVAKLGGEVPWLVERAQSEMNFEVRVALVQAIGSLGGEKAGRFLSEAVGEPALPVGELFAGLAAARTLASADPTPLGLLPKALSLPEAWADGSDALLQIPIDGFGYGSLAEALRDEHALQLAAIDAAGRSRSTAPARALVELLSDPDPALRGRAADSLRRLTNLSFGTRWSDEDLDESRRAGRLQLWREIVERNRGQPRVAWLASGFVNAGYDVPALKVRHAWELVRAVGGWDYTSYNAQRALMVLFREQPPTLSWTKGRACHHWLKWLSGRQKRFNLGKPPKSVARACNKA